MVAALARPHALTRDYRRAAESVGRLNDVPVGMTLVGRGGAAIKYWYRPAAYAVPGARLLLTSFTLAYSRPNPASPGPTGAIVEPI